MIGSLLCSVSAKADTNLPAKVEVFKPSIVLQKLIYDQEVRELRPGSDWGQRKTPREKKHWVVYSDRDNNTTYTTPGGSTPFGKLDFNERVIIAKIENNYALVYTDPKFTIWPGFSEKAVSKGWIPMENLLLWESCPVDSKGIYQKALLALNLDSKGIESADYGWSYHNPVTKTQGDSISTDMTFYYVMKTDPKSGLKLLASQATLGGNSDQVLYGWVYPNSFVPWNQRSCLEPNWKPSDVAYFNSPDGKEYPIYDNPELKGSAATKYRYGVKNKDDAKSTSSTRFRMNAYDTRFPILDQDPATADPNIYKMTTFGVGGRSVLNPADDNIPADKQKLIDMLNKLKHINIIFVIDGTRSMRPYFAAAKEAIKSGIQYFDPNKFTIRVGAVIYRDYTDGDFLIEKVPLTKPNNPQLLSFFDTAGSYGAQSSPADHTIAEALFKGLEVATDPTTMGFNKDESNIIVVIGDCGNDPNDTKCLTSAQIVDRLVANNIQVVSFQVESRSDLAYALFNEQMRNIIKDNITRQYHALNPNVKIKFNALANGYDFSSNASSEFFIGAIRRPANDVGIVNASELTPIIENNIGKFAESVQRQLDEAISVTSGKKPSSGFKANNAGGVSISEELIIKRIGKEAYDNLVKSRLAFTGYAPKKDAQNRDYWKPVVFLSSEEFEGLINRLADLYNNANTDGDRKPYIDAVKALIRIMVPDITEKDMDEMGIDEVMRLAAGLNESSDAVKGRSLKEIQDPRVVPAPEYATLIQTFMTKYKYLRDLKNKKYMYSFETPNGQKFYWIPVEDLP